MSFLGCIWCFIKSLYCIICYILLHDYSIFHFLTGILISLFIMSMLVQIPKQYSKVWALLSFSYILQVCKIQKLVILLAVHTLKILYLFTRKYQFSATCKGLFIKWWRKLSGFSTGLNLVQFIRSQWDDTDLSQLRFDLI